MKIIREEDEKDRVVRVRVKDDDEDKVWSAFSCAFFLCGFILFLLGYGIGWLFILLGLYSLSKTHS